MLDGITVLNESVGYGIDGLGDFFVGLFIILGIAGIIISIFMIHEEKDSAIGIVVSLCFLLASLITYNLFNYEFTQYEVTIEESVNFKEFTEQYEVIEQRGEIYIIK